MPRAYSILKTGNTVIELDTTILDKMITELPDKADDFVYENATAAEMYMKDLSPLDTGANKSSIHVKMLHNDYSSVALASAQHLNPDAKIADFPKPTKRAAAHVGPAMEYSIYLEFGTHKMSARPFVYPAMERVERQMPRFARQIFGDERF